MPDKSNKVLRIKDFMTPNPVCIKPTYSILDVAKIFHRKKIDGAPVIAENGGIIGIFTKSHLLSAVIARLDLDTPVEKLMNRTVVTISEEDTPEDAWNLGWTMKVGRLPVVNDSGSITGMWARTNLVKAFEKKANDTISRLNAVLLSANNAIIAVDKTGNIITFNKSAAKITGVYPENAIGNPIEGILNNTRIMEILKTGESYLSQKQRINNIAVLASYNPIWEDDEIIGAMAVFQDMSEIEVVSAELEVVKQLNAELDAILESSYDGMVLADPEGILLRANRAYERITGLDTKTMIGKSVAELVRTGIISRSATLAVLEKKNTVTITQTVKTGKELLVTGSPVFDVVTGEIKFIINNCRDLSELNDLQQKLDETTQLTEIYFNEIQMLRAKQLRHGEIIAKSAAMEKVFGMALKVAEVDCNVLLLGESGVGKDMITKVIHKNGPRAGGPFIKVNCGAIPEHLLESEFFGYEGGAFTGAKKEGKPGTFELADNGTLFLDEIGDLPLNLQVKLLNALQDKEFKRVGGTKPISVNFRLVAATNKNLQAKVEDGTFRLDLYYRLDVVSIIVPSLRERKDDILPLLLFFLNKYNSKYGQDKKLTSEVIDLFYSYSWPGNVRELENIVERMVITSESDYITADAIPEHIKKYEPYKYSEHVAEPEVLRPSDEKRKLENLYEQYQSTRKVAKVLGVHQSTVVRKMKKYNLTH